MDVWESLVERKIREAMEEGDFDNLPGKGQPLDLAENPFEDPELRMAHRLLRNAGFAPAWIEERKDVYLESEELQRRLERAHQRWRSTRAGNPARERVWQQARSAYQEQVRR